MELTETEKKRMTIEETQKSLPIYPFKESFIDAVRGHQVHATFIVFCRKTNAINNFI